jgi:filamentous hemagglutinin family protein
MQPVVRPIALAVWLGLGFGGQPVQAGSMNPLTSVSRGVMPGALPVLLDPSKLNAGRNAATYGKGVVTQTGTAMLIDQSDSDKAIYEWKSFDIGSQAKVDFKFKNADGSALNRVPNSVAPSQIFGSLRSYYEDAAKNQILGGEVFLINRNGILIGSGAQVNVGGLFLSALDMSDEDYKSGLQNSIKSVNPTFFKWVDKDPNTGAEIATYDPGTNYVKVETGANINTSSGGRVFLLGARVDNEGTIQSSKGQVVLAAGSEVYLNTPSSVASPLYMSEANENVPTVKGLLVEVNSARKAGEAAGNAGQISTPLGNTTIVGWAVNQTGRISATTGVSQNGSVFLQARSGVDARQDPSGRFMLKRAQQGGNLTLGEGSRIEISPDNTGKSSANSAFTASRIELSGQTIDMQRAAQIQAPGAVVNVRAEDRPAYEPSAQVQGGLVAAGSGRVILGDLASIDVSGTTDTTVSVARHFVTTEALGYTDLKDAPIQKTGPLYMAKLTFDTRQGAPILGDTSAYLNAIEKTAGERLSAGGTVSLVATNAVVTSQSSSVNVSGGMVSYTSALVKPSVLQGANGQRYTLNTAPVDQVYVGVAGVGNMTPSRFGNVVDPTVAGMARMEYGYQQGSQGGALNVVAPKVVLDGRVEGKTMVGERQRAGLDALAKASRLTLGAFDNGAGTSVLFGDAAFRSAVLRDVVVTRDTSPLENLYDRSGYPAQSRVSAATLNASGFGELTLAANGQIRVEDGADLALPDLGKLTMRAGGFTEAGQSHKGIDLGGNITAHGGTVDIQSMATSTSLASSTDTLSGSVRLGEGKAIDVSGTWVNQRLDGTSAGTGLAGGRVTLASGHGLVLGQGSSIDVSGGATLNPSGAVKGSSAGTITLESNTESSLLSPTQALRPQAMEVAGASLKGYGVSKGGSLALRANRVELVADAGDGRIAQGALPGSLVIGADFLTQGGFASYSIEGAESLTVTQGTTLAPRVDSWMATSAARALRTGSPVSQAMAVTRLPDGLRPAAHLSLLARGTKEASQGTLTVAQDARILGDTQSRISLLAGQRLNLEGRIQSAGGQVSLGLNGRGKLESNVDGQSRLQLGAQAEVDVSGTTVYTPNAKGLLQGQVLSGGTVTIGVDKGNNTESQVVLASSASIRTDGARGDIDVARALGESGPAYTRRSLVSEGGDIVFNVGAGGAALAARMSAQGGDARAMGGSLSVNMVDSAKGRLVLQSAESGTDKLQSATVTLSTQALSKAGFADVSLSAPQEIAFNGDLSWWVPRHLTLAAPLFSTSKAARVSVSSGSTLRMGRPSGLGNVPLTLTAPRIDAASLNLQSGLLALYGQMALQGFGSLSVQAGSEIRLMGINDGSPSSQAGALPGGLMTKADVQLTAPQVTASTASRYTLDASGAQVRIDGGDTTVAAPLSAGAQLTIKARTIDQRGVLRAPLGSITLDATERITLGEGSETSVSGQDLTVPFGSTTGGGQTLTYLNSTKVIAPVEKAVVLEAHGQSVQVSQQAKVDLSGGGALTAYEFVPGTGGSRDIFAGSVDGAFAVVPTVKGYAPTDEAILAIGGLNQGSGRNNVLALGNTITFGDNGVLPAGSYAILPARYALLPGAFLVKPTSAGSVAGLNGRQALTDGAFVVNALRGVQGVSSTPALPAAYVVMPSDVARRYSEIKTTNLDSYFSDKARLDGVAAPRLAADAGRLAISAGQVELQGLIDFAHRTGQGGQLDLSASRIHVGAQQVAGALNVTHEQLNQTGADSIVLGGIRQATGADGKVAVSVAASEVTVEAPPDVAGTAGAIRVSDITLAATQSVTLNDGVVIDATAGTGAQSELAVSGNGALLRVSHDAGTNTTRDVSAVKQVGATGDLKLGRVQLRGGTVVAEATRNTSVAAQPSSAQIDASKLVIGARRIVAGDTSGSDVVADPSTLVLSEALAAQLNKAQDLSLRSFAGTDLYQGATLGGANTRSLTVDTANLRVKATGESAVSLTAGQVQLLNTTGAKRDVAVPSLHATTLNIVATGQQGGNGHITLGGGDVQISGAERAQLQAAGSVVLSGTGSVSTPSDLILTASSLTARQGADSSLQAGGWFKLAAPASGVSAAKVATPGLGARVAVTAGTIDQQGTILLPSASLNLDATYELRFGAGSLTSLAGLQQKQDGVALHAPGGALSASSAKANVTQSAGSVIDVSAGSGQGAAGSMAFSAPLGAVKLQGSLLARSTSQQAGGSLRVDSGKTVDLAALANTVDAGRTAEQANFSQSLDVRVRARNQHLALAQGTTLRAEQISLAADQGDVLVAGELSARSAQSAQVRLSAGGDVRILDGAQVAAHGVGADASASVELNASGLVRADGRLGTVKLLGGVIDVSGQDGAAQGDVRVRAERSAWMADDTRVGSEIKGARSVQLEAYRRLAATRSDTLGNALVDDDTVAQARASVADFFGGDAQALTARWLAAQPQLAHLLDVRAGVEITAPKDLTVGSDLNLLTWRAAGEGSVLTAAPVNLTLRAAGNLFVQGSISDGFALLGGVDSDGHLVDGTVANTDWIQPGAAAHIRLIGGADLRAADVLTTKAVADSSADVQIGRSDDGQSANVMVRTTTGNIDIRAARDVVLTNPQAVVYTTGRYAPQTEGFVLDDLGDFPAVLQGFLGWEMYNANPFTSGGGSISVQAGRDVVGLTDISQGADPTKNVQSFTTDWWWRRKNEDGTVAWWSRYDLFQQGFATMGGGRVQVTAGRDAWNVSVSAASSGYTDDTGAHHFGGGDVSLRAGRDILGGSTFSSGDTSVQAGRDITVGAWVSSDSARLDGRQTMPSGLSVLYGNGQTDITARGDLAINQLTQAGLVSQAFPFPQLSTSFTLWGLAPDAELRLTSVAGDLTKTADSLNRFKYEDSGMARQSTAVKDSPETLLPARVRFQAAAGSINLASDLNQVAAQTQGEQGAAVRQPLSLEILARDDVNLRSVTQWGADPRVATPTAAGNLVSSLSVASALPAYQANNPVRIEALTGDVKFAGKLDLTQALRLMAGRDISMDDGSGRISIIHGGDTDLSLIQAGRDLSFSNSLVGDFGLLLSGPGDLVVATGRSIQLNQSAGIKALGNRLVPEVPARSAHITVLPGVSLDKGDVTGATASYFNVLGGLGVGDFAADLYAQIQRDGHTWPGLDSAVAKGFASLDTAAQLKVVRQLVGDARYAQRMQTFVQHRLDGSLQGDEAAAQFTTLSAAEQKAFVGWLMATAWSERVAASRQLEAVSDMLAARPDNHAASLLAFMQTRTGQSLSIPQAMTAFAALNAEEQALFNTQVLSAEMSKTVSKAAALSGEARQAAYLNAYNALDTMFPSASVSRADLQMGGSTIQTQQGSAIRVFAPNGAINVGQLTAGSGAREASKLGLLTAGGGDMDVVARDDVLVNQSRVFTVGSGDELIWSSTRDVDAGRGGKTVTATASPVYYLDSKGQLQVDVTSAISGSGIKSSGKARIAAPRGAINAGDAGIQADAGLDLAAQVILNATNIQAPSVTGAPPPAPVNAALAAPTPTQPTAAGVKEGGEDKDNGPRKRRKRNILLDFLGFGDNGES